VGRREAKIMKAQDCLFRSIFFLQLVLFSIAFSESDFPQESSIGFINPPFGQTYFDEILRKGVALYQKPKGEILGKIYFDLNDTLHGFFLATTSGYKKVQFQYMKTIDCYAKQIPVIRVCNKII
jgi:hypothetical protein